MRKKSIIYVISFLSVMAIMMTGCGTKKKSREELSFFGKAYQNTTAYYNGFFNAEEIMDATYQRLEASNKDNYTKMLKVFPYEGGDADAVKAELDRAIEKVSVVATIHKPSRWRDDCYVLLSEAQYLQKDYESAEASLRYTVREFDPVNNTNKNKKSKLTKKEKDAQRKEKEKQRQKEKKERQKKNKKRKRMTREERAEMEAKEKEEAEKQRLAELKKQASVDDKTKVKKDKDGLFHRPVFQDAMIWMARTYIKREKFSLADAHLRRLEEDPAIFDEVRSELYPTRAQYYIAQGRWEKAEGPMEQAYIHAADRRSKARYAYILAQIKEKKAKYSEAEVYYDKVIKERPHFDMIFNARLRKALNGHRAGKLNGEELEDTLDDMLNDDKYDDYHDQIYTALALLKMESGDKEEGLALFQKALTSGDKSSIYKGEAYYQLAEYHFGEMNYVEAKFYYDSTLTAMTQDDDRRPHVEGLSQNLTAIAEQIQIINLQDSLLTLAGLPKEELLRRAKKMEEREQKEEAASANAQDNLTTLNQTFNPQNNLATGKSTFFAYDPLIRDKGYRDFKKKWGDRPLADNWRWSTQVFNEDVENSAQASNTNEGDRTDLEDDQLIQKYFGTVPKNDESRSEVLKTKEKALFELGKLYRNNMKNCTASISTLEQLLSEFPGTQFEADALFYLYLCNLDLNNAEAQQYAEVLVRKYPNSLYAMSISDPDFLKKEEQKKLALDSYYQETYDLFSHGKYDEVRQRLAQVENLFPNTGKLTAKFALLQAMLIGQSEGKEAYINALRDVIAKNKETPEATRAREIMRFLQGDEQAFVVVDDASASSKFKIEDDRLHYIITVILDLGTSKLNDLKVQVSSYNRKYHKNDRLNLSTLDLDIENSTPVILIRKFETKEEAMKYYDDVMRRKDKFISDKVQYEVYAISQHNYREVIKDRSITTYRSFFNQYYLEGDQ